MDLKKRLAIITTHPIQYNAPLFRLLSVRKVISIKVFYTWSQLEQEEKYDPGFGKNIKWDIPLLDGYEYTFVKNVSSKPGSHHFKGINNPSLIKEVQDWKPDAILVYGWSFKSHLKAIRFFKDKIKVIFRGDSTLLDEPPGLTSKKVLRRFFLKWVYSHVDIALYAGELNRQYFLKHGLQEHQLIFGPHTVENKRFFSNHSIVEKAGELRAKYTIKDMDVVFLFAGKLEPKKQPDLLLSAFKKISDQHAHLVIVGDGILSDKLKAAAIDDSRIHFMDFQNQTLMPIIYAICDVFVLPSKGPGETWGLAVNEAMASGKAVIVSNKCGCAPDLVDNGINGYIFKSNSEDDLLDKMKLMLTKEKNTSFGNHSLQKITNWNYEVLCSEIENIFLFNASKN